LEEDLHVPEGEQRRFVAYRCRKVEDQGDQRNAIADFALAFDRGHPSRILFLAELISSSGVRIQIEVRDGRRSGSVQVEYVEESNVLMPDIRFLAFDDFHIEKRLDVLKEARQNGR